MCNNCEFFFSLSCQIHGYLTKSTMTCVTNWVQSAYLPEYTSPPGVRVVIRVHLEFVLFCLVFCWPLFVYMYLLIFVIVFAVLRSTGSNDQFSCTVDCNVKIYTYTKTNRKLYVHYCQLQCKVCTKNIQSHSSTRCIYSLV